MKNLIKFVQETEKELLDYGIELKIGERLTHTARAGSLIEIAEPILVNKNFNEAGDGVKGSNISIIAKVDEESGKVEGYVQYQSKKLNSNKSKFFSIEEFRFVLAEVYSKTEMDYYLDAIIANIKNFKFVDNVTCNENKFVVSFVAEDTEDFVFTIDIEEMKSFRNNIYTIEKVIFNMYNSNRRKKELKHVEDRKSVKELLDMPSNLIIKNEEGMELLIQFKKTAIIATLDHYNSSVTVKVPYKKLIQEGNKIEAEMIKHFTHENKSNPLVVFIILASLSKRSGIVNYAIGGERLQTLAYHGMEYQFDITRPITAKEMLVIQAMFDGKYKYISALDAETRLGMFESYFSRKGASVK